MSRNIISLLSYKTQNNLPDESTLRRTNILKILLTAIIIFSCIILILYGINYIHQEIAHIPHRGASPLILILVTAIFFGIYKITVHGYITASSLLFITVLFLIACYVAFTWDVTTPFALLIFSLVITMSGILINTKFLIKLTILVGFSLLTIGISQIEGLHHPLGYWKNEPIGYQDIAAYIVTLIVFAAVSWLYTREIEKSLARARRSETALKQERDLLEIKVEERTRELKQMQLEKMFQLYRLADFGRLTAGLIHDLVTPLTQVSLELENIKNNTTSARLNQAIQGTHRMERFVQSVRKQLQGQEQSVTFNLVTEIHQVINVFHAKAKSARIVINLNLPKKLTAFGNPVRYNQLVTNLIANALDAYDGITRKLHRQIDVNLAQSNGNAILTVTDFGSGIKPSVLKHIFEPFYTTKDTAKGTGIGLSISKLIIEKHFNGSINVTSTLKTGTVFIVSFPLKKSR